MRVELVASAATPSAGSKGGGPEGYVALAVFFSLAALRTAAPVLIEAIRAWSAARANRTVRLIRGQNALEIKGAQNAADMEIIRTFLER